MDDAAAWSVAALLGGGEPDMTLRVGDLAPDFALTATMGEAQRCQHSWVGPLWSSFFVGSGDCTAPSIWCSCTGSAMI